MTFFETYESREMFNKWQAQRWWGENYDRIMELYNVQRFNCQALNTPSRSEDGVIYLPFTIFLSLSLKVAKCAGNMSKRVNFSSRLDVLG